MHQARHPGDLHAALLRQHTEGFFLHASRNGHLADFFVRQESRKTGGIYHRTGKDMTAHISSFFKDRHTR